MESRVFIDEVKAEYAGEISELENWVYRLEHEMAQLIVISWDKQMLVLRK